MMKKQQRETLVHCVKTNYLLFTVLIACLNYSCVAQRCSKNITNKVVFEGQPASFSRMQNGLAVDWTFAPSNVLVDPERPISSDNDTVNPEFKNTFKVDSKQLTILKATVAPQRNMPFATAGLYTLHYFEPNCTTAAGLIVVRGEPECTCDRNSGKVKCSVDYAAYKEQRIQPVMTWKDAKGKTLKELTPTPSALDVTNPGLQSSEAELRIAEFDVPIYKCQLTFSDPSIKQPKYASRNAPTFTASCTVKNCKSEKPPPTTRKTTTRKTTTRKTTTRKTTTRKATTRKATTRKTTTPSRTRKTWPAGGIRTRKTTPEATTTCKP